MLNKFCQLVFFYNLVILCLPLYSQTILALDDIKTETKLSGYLKIIRDPHRTKTFNEIRQEFALVKPLKEAEPNFGFTADTIWCNFNLKTGQASPNYLIYLDHGIYEATLYCQTRSSLTVKQTGLKIPQSQRPFTHRRIIFPLTLNPNTTYEFYLKINTIGTTSLPLTLFPTEAFKEYDNSINLFFGICFGILAGLILYMLFISFSVKDLSYFLFCVFTFFNLLFQLSYNGFTSYYLWPELPILEVYLLNLSGGATIIACLFFTNSFLKLKQNLRGAAKFIKILVAIAALSLPLSLAGLYRLNLIIINITMLIGAIFICLLGWLSFQRGLQHAGFFFLAFLFLILSVLILSLKNFGILSSNFFTSQSLLFGSIFESIFLSLALADYINTINRENLNIKEKLLKIKENEIQLVYQRLYKDTLTDLANRNKLALELQKNRSATLFIINIDSFRQINELYGTLIGNSVILEVVKRLKNLVLPKNYELFRLHADEFAILFSEQLNLFEMQQFAQRILDLCQKESYQINSFIIPLNFTLGIASGEANLLPKADSALSKARQLKIEYHIFNPEEKEVDQIKENLKCLELLRFAVEKDTIFPVFMPILNNKSGKIEKYEALMRLRDQKGEILYPTQFLKIAQKAKIYPKLSQSIIAKVFRIARISPYQISLNISLQDIDFHQPLDFIMDELKNNPCHKKIVFELLESESIEAFERVGQFIKEVKKLGCEVAIDDFGSGYSNFEYILKLNIDYLKIDSALIKEIHENKIARTIVETIAHFTRRLKITSIAEYVHCQDIFSLVRYLGIDYSQGAYIGLPSESMPL